MFKKMLRLVVSSLLILSIGYSQLFLAFYGFGSTDTETTVQPVPLHSKVAYFSSKVKTDHSADQQNQDWENTVLEKDPDEYSPLLSVELQLAFAAVFICLLSLSFAKYHIRFLRYYRNFFFTYSHRLHLYNGVFTI